MINARCLECGFEASEGAVECQECFDILIARDFNDARYGRWHRMAVDAYCLQHPDKYCVSAKSLMAHLGGLCCAFEHNGDLALLRALSQSLSGTPKLEKPKLPTTRGALTIGDVLAAPDPESYGRKVEQWARSVWDAYTSLHGFARDWIASL